MILKIAIVITSVLVIVAILLFMGNRMYHRNVKLGREIQQKYWTANADEKKHLLEKGIDDLSWDDSLRLLHLTCLEILSNGPGREQLMLEG